MISLLWPLSGMLHFQCQYKTGRNLKWKKKVAQETAQTSEKVTSVVTGYVIGANMNGKLGNIWYFKLKRARLSNLKSQGQQNLLRRKQISGPKESLELLVKELLIPKTKLTL